ncbi:unnamed protein product [Adineta steineri]|uniref:Uncharacterized protein n=1 Tax=Adineta steineri TaxID=433720 RepID=A0A818SUB4_9BILA|nr:unnamed protein product [Adineta steineri]
MGECCAYLYSLESFLYKRNRNKADEFGNVLLIMTVTHAFTVDLKPFSEYSDEEELLSTGVCFTVYCMENCRNK